MPGERDAWPGSGPLRQGIAIASPADASARLDALREAVATRHGGRCLSERYTRQAATYDFACAQGHRFRASASNVLHRGSWCPACAGNAPLDAAPLDAAALGAAAARIGARLDPERPVHGAGARVALFCTAMGHRFARRGASLVNRRATGCPTCHEAAAGQAMLARATAAAGRAGLTVLDTSWPGRRSTITLRCRCGHTFGRSAERVYLVGRTRCPRCRGRGP